jgi:hypothetical protein
MTAKLKILITLFVLIAGMGCTFVQNMVFPPPASPTPTRPSLSSEVGRRTAIPPIEVASPSPEPFDNPEPIACSDDECLNACLDRLNTVLETKPLESIGNSIYEKEGASFNLVVYKVAGDEIKDPAVLYVPDEYRKYQKDTAAHLRIWKFYVALVPAELRTLVDEFVIFTDGPEGDAVAWVQPSSTREGYWQVGIDLLDADYPVYLADTLIHETGHVLTLSASQLPSNDNHYYYYDDKKHQFYGCDQFVVAGSCTLPNSYINLFYQKFWKKSYAEWWDLDQKAQDTNTTDEYFAVMEQFYGEHEDWFLDSYAATSIEEDMAESFAFFALHPKPRDTRVFQQKITFYYDFPELVAYRQQMIQGLCSYIR